MRSGSIKEEDFLTPKIPKIQYSDVQGSTSLLSLSTGLQTKMLSFSNPGSESPSLTKRGGLGYTSGFPHYAYTVNTGLTEGGVGGPFTASQWVELQHQALVYKYIQANISVPSGLLLGLKRSVSPYLLSGWRSGSYSYTPNSWGWGGSFHLGFSGNSSDPEPGRCRRTDGKKWRCSRDAVIEHKYCERHLNRGRHRSRKLVEGRSGQAVAGTGLNALATSAPVISGSGVASSSVVPAQQQQQLKGLQPHAADIPSTDLVKFDRLADDQDLSVLNPVADSKSSDLIFSNPKYHIATEEPSHTDFGLVSSDSLLNPSIKSSYMNNTTSFDPIFSLNESENHDQYPLRHFIDGELKPDWTQLSMSIPMSSDFSSTSSSSPQDKMTPSPLSLSNDFNPNQKEMNWVPISWGNSMGGPLGEVLLNNASSSSVEPAKNLSNGLWFGSSPTGVLQKANFSSLSNSSCGSSPRGETKKIDGCVEPSGDMFGPHLPSL